VQIDAVGGQRVLQLDDVGLGHDLGGLELEHGEEVDGARLVLDTREATASLRSARALCW